MVDLLQDSGEYDFTTNTRYGELVPYGIKVSEFGKGEGEGSRLAAFGRGPLGYGGRSPMKMKAKYARGDGAKAKKGKKKAKKASGFF